MIEGLLGALMGVLVSIFIAINTNFMFVALAILSVCMFVRFVCEGIKNRKELDRIIGDIEAYGNLGVFSLAVGMFLVHLPILNLGFFVFALNQKN